MMKRCLDILIAGCGLVLLSPLLVAICLTLRVTGEGKVVYRQQRLGQHLKPFNVYKFATMLEASPNMLTGSITVPDDPRVLPVGKFLRKTKLNEIPQLLNVLLGDMSLIGPRPHVEEDLEGIPKANLIYCYSIKPGLSGIASILLRNEEDLLGGEVDQRGFYRKVIAPYKNKLDSWYVTNSTLTNYLTLVFLTLVVVLGVRSQVIFRLWPSLPSLPKELLNKFSQRTTNMRHRN